MEIDLVIDSISEYEVVCTKHTTDGLDVRIFHSSAGKFVDLDVSPSIRYAYEFRAVDDGRDIKPLVRDCCDGVETAPFGAEKP